ncbi:MAG TPA: type I restriction-modification system subunit M N-terminal domain-containing protein [Sulfuriferula sp.]|nr:type I restriction-modification system subunit M N-terminal domain-containing protein [Sulfuriferula sp.]
MNTSNIVQKLWNYCNVLRDDGMSYGDYVEQLTYLLFLKMADERSRPPYNQTSPVPAGYDWPSLLKKDGDELFDHYRHTLEELGKQKGLLGLIFTKSQNKFDSRRFSAALTLRAPMGVQSPVGIVRTRPSCGGCFNPVARAISCR